MARIAILLPRDDMIQPAQELAQQYHLDVIGIYAVHTSGIKEKLEEVINAGADIVMARGGQALYVKHNSTLPLVEIQLTGLDVVLLAMQAEKVARKPFAKVGLIGFRNMFGIIPEPSRLPNINLHTYFLDEPDEVVPALAQAVDRAIEDGMDILLGGENVCALATQRGLPSIYTASGPESIADACRVARHVSYAIDQEKRNTAEVQVILDHTVDALIQIDAQGIVKKANPAAEQLLSANCSAVRGRPICQVLTSLKQADIDAVLSEGEEFYAVPLKINSALFLASISPVSTDAGVSGAILSIASERQLELYAAEQQNELRRQGFDAPFYFSQFIAKSAQAQELIKKAQRYAQFDLPLLILGELGTEKEELAQCIHNNGAFSNQAFLHFNCNGPNPEVTTQRLFGPGGFIEKAKGTVFLNEVSRLSPEGQYLLYRTITGRAESSYGSLEYRTKHSFRLVLADSRDLFALAQSGELREDLYYAISVMTLEIPPLRQRKEDIRGWAEFFFHTLQQRHGRYVHLTQGAWDRFCAHEWPGNLAQLRSVCERILVDAPRRNVDEQFLDTIFFSSAPVQRNDEEYELQLEYRDPKAAQISKLLQLYQGRRTLVAKEMGISTTTLWRYMKKYGIQR